MSIGRTLNLNFTSEFRDDGPEDHFLTLQGDTILDKKDDMELSGEKIEPKPEQEYKEDTSDILEDMEEPFYRDSDNETEFTDNEVIRIPEEESSIEGAPYYRKEPGKPRKYKEEKPIMYGTETVAEMLGITAQTVRCYCDDFPEFITISRKEKGQRILTQENIDQLRYVLEIKEKKNLTKSQLKAYLQNPEKYEMTDKDREIEVLKQMLTGITTNMEKQYRALVNEVIENNRLMIENKDNAMYDMFQELSGKIQTQQEQISGLVGSMKKQEEISTIEKEKALFQEEIRILKEKLSKNELKYESLKHDYDEQSLKIQELEKKKKGGFLGLFK